MTPLHWAVDRGYISMIETLLRYGGDVTMESKFGKTPLEVASDNGRHDIYEILQNADQVLIDILLIVWMIVVQQFLC